MRCSIANQATRNGANRGVFNLRARIAAVLVMALYLNGCLSSTVSEPAEPSRYAGSVGGVLVLGKVVYEKELAGGGLGPKNLNKALTEELQSSNLFNQTVIERDVPTNGLDAGQPAYLVKWRIVDVDYDSSNPGLIAIVALSLTLVPLFFVGLARTSVTETLEVRMKLYDVSAAKIERVKDEDMAEYFNAFDVSGLTPLLNKSYEVTSEYKLGSDDNQQSDRFEEEVAADLARRLMMVAGPDIQRVVDGSPSGTVPSAMSSSGDDDDDDDDGEDGAGGDTTVRPERPKKAEPDDGAPSGLAGFEFGMTKQEAEAACTEAGHEVAPFDKGIRCSGTVASVGFETATFLVLTKNVVTRIVVHEQLVEKPKAVVDRYAEMKDLLTKKYGKASKNRIELANRCEGVLNACIRQKRMVLETEWKTESGHRVRMRLKAGPLLELDYRAPKKKKAKPKPENLAL